MTMVNSYPERMNLSFSGCGFLCIYHAGVAAAIKEYAPHLIQNKISGASAGAIVAAGLVTNICISQATSTILKIVSQARSRALGALHPAFNLLGLVREEIERTLPPDAYKRCTGRLQISLTRWSDNKNVVVTEFESNKELIDAIICSCFIPVYCGITPPTYRGEAYIDGGFTDNQPSYDDHTVTVSPFSGESDICPPDWDSASFFGICFSRTSIRFTTRNLFRLTACLMPPSTEDCSKMCLQGFEDALRFLTKNAMAPCIRCLTIQTNVDQRMESCSPIEERTQLSPNMPRLRNRTSSNVAKKRLESECDTCCESEHMYNTAVSEVFPSIMTRTFDEAFAAEDSFFKYLLSFRMFRYARTALGVGKLPWDVLVIFSKNVAAWLSAVVAPEWLRAKINALVDFVLMEIERQKSRYSRFSCLLPVPEISYPKREREPEIELSEDAKKELAVIRESDRRKKVRLETRVSSVTPSTDWTLLDDVDNEDSLQHVIEYSNSHDAMYEFHYLDENNRMRSFELFNIADPFKRHECHSRIGSVPPSRPVSMVVEEEAEQVEEEAACSSKADEGDSGLSGVEGHTDTGRRDACCSPVRHFPSLRTSGRGKGSTRRHTSHTGGSSGQPSTSRKQHSASRSGSVVSGSGVSVGGVRSASSDSEGDGADKLFVPARRQRTSSIEYDGEPEPSDTDIPV
ncbi:hypothetical protein Aduo_008000 [Ancylostoma duodenale]